MESIIVLIATKFHYLVVGGWVLAWLLTNQVRRRNLIILSIFALPIAYIAGKLIGTIVNNPRPFVVNDVIPLFAHAADNGFPSEHALLATTISAVVYTVNKPLGIALLTISLMIGIARILANVHHTFDIVGGTVIAVIVVSFCSVCIKRFKFLKH